MGLNQEQRGFLEKREGFVKSWRYVGPLLFAVIAGFAIYLYVRTPLLINPYEVFARIESGSIERSSLETMALLLPLMFIVVCFLLLVLIVMMYAAFSNEKRYRDIVTALDAGKMGHGDP
jgi:hypothetical protein